MKSIRMSLKEIRKKKTLSLLILLVCTLALYTALSAFTNASGSVYQQRLFERNIGADLQRVLHLDYQRTEEDAAFASVLREYLEEIKTLPGVVAVGQFDAAGVYFRELENSEEYKERNAALLKGQKYENYPAISQLLSADEEILPLVKNGITEYETADSGFLPIYASEVFRDFLPKGSILTDARTGDRYQVVGYLPQGMLWPEEDDLIRFPMISLDGWFVAPFTQQSRSDIITQLSSLHNTYLFLEEGADADAIKEQVRSGSLARGFEASALPLSEEYEAYRAQTAALTARQLALAFLSARWRSVRLVQC